MHQQDTVCMVCVVECRSVLQRVAVCRSVLQQDTVCMVCCSVSHIAVWYSVLCYSVLQCVAVCCNRSVYGAVFYIVL